MHHRDILGQKNDIHLTKPIRLAKEFQHSVLFDRTIERIAEVFEAILYVSKFCHEYAIKCFSPWLPGKCSCSLPQSLSHIDCERCP